MKCKKHLNFKLSEILIINETKGNIKNIKEEQSICLKEKSIGATKSIVSLQKITVLAFVSENP